MALERSASSRNEDFFEVPMMNAADLIRASRRALSLKDGTQVRDCLIELSDLLQNPGELAHVLDSEFRTLLQRSLASNLDNVPLTALSVITDSLHALSRASLVGENIALIKVLLKFIKLDVILGTTSSEILVPAFEVLAWWCSRGAKHRATFLEVFPVEFLDEIYTRDFPLVILSAYTNLVASIIRFGKVANGLLPTVLRIFARSLRDYGVGNTCEIAETVCEAMANVFEDFQDENVVDEVIESRLASALVAHVMAIPTYIFPGACVRNCLRPMMKLFVSFMGFSEELCQRFVDQGVLSVIEVSLAGPDSEASRYASMALTNVFAYSPFSIEYALHSTVAEHLFQLRENPDQALRIEALRASSNLFSRASSAQIFSMIKMNYVPEIVKLVRSPYPDVVHNGLLSLLAVIGATNFTDPSKLPNLHELLRKQDVQGLSEILRYHKIKEIRLAAIAVSKFMASYLDEEKLGKGAIPRWSGVPRSPTASDLQSIISMPR